jgi:hypothetical protein
VAGHKHLAAVPSRRSSPASVGSFAQQVRSSDCDATLEFFLTRNRVIHVSKVLDPHDAVQMIPFRKSSYISVSVLEQTAANVVCDTDVQRRAMFIGENVHPIIVVSHASQKESEMFRFAQHDRLAYLFASFSAIFVHQFHRLINHVCGNIKRGPEADRVFTRAKRENT